MVAVLCRVRIAAFRAPTGAPLAAGAYLRSRGLSTRADVAAASPPNVVGSAPKPPAKLIFEGPKASILQILKGCSIANLAFSLASAPAVVLLSTSGSPTSRALLIATVVTFSVSTTAMLHVASKPYVTAIHALPESRVRISTVSFLARISSQDVALAELGPAGSLRLFANMTVSGRSLYVDPVGVTHDEEAMRKIWARCDPVSVPSS
mmetsp:Transcript_21918/g.56397  ORF Transcript_21918/g.56397 Transcript_21918/m.56397 type:complete len:207 (-) Transcript_21918:215-835(-)